MNSGGFGWAVILENKFSLCLIRMLPSPPTNLLSASSVHQVNNRVPNVPGEAVLSDTDVPLGQVDVEGGLLQDWSFPCFLLAKEWNTAGPEHGIIKPHQLHFREICTDRAAGQGRAAGPRENHSSAEPLELPHLLQGNGFSRQSLSCSGLQQYNSVLQCLHRVTNRNGDTPHRNTSS